jgi:hemerythrin-like domain-containing protein
MEATTISAISRRNFLIRGGALAAGAALLGPAQLLAAEKKEMAPADVTPTEDLMREHGVLRRLMLMMADLGRRLQGSAEFPLSALTQIASLIHRFIQDYHEKDEEEYLFPRFEKAGKLTDLVQVLKAQHQAGRKLMADLEGRATAGNLKNPGERQIIGAILSSFIRMYRPHAAWEDTVLYPAFRSVITPREFVALGDKFEDKEQELFGKDGFEKIVVQVARLEKQLGLFDLSQFTAKG